MHGSGFEACVCRGVGIQLNDRSESKIEKAPRLLLHVGVIKRFKIVCVSTFQARRVIQVNVTVDQSRNKVTAVGVNDLRARRVCETSPDGGNDTVVNSNPGVDQCCRSLR